MANRAYDNVEEQALVDWLTGAPDRLKRLIRENVADKTLDEACAYFAKQFSPALISDVFRGKWKPKAGERFSLPHLVDCLLRMVETPVTPSANKKRAGKGKRGYSDEIEVLEVSLTIKMAAMKELRQMIKMMASAHPSFVAHRKRVGGDAGNRISATQRDTAFESGLKVSSG